MLSKTKSIMYSKPQLYMAAYVADAFGEGTPDRLIECLGLEADRLFLSGVMGYEQGVPPNPSPEAMTRAEMSGWQDGWDYAWSQCEYRDEAWPDYRPSGIEWEEVDPRGIARFTTQVHSALGVSVGFENGQYTCWAWGDEIPHADGAMLGVSDSMRKVIRYAEAWIVQRRIDRAAETVQP